jgi:hydrogenase nickel incorporation protein HypA/HybF
VHELALMEGVIEGALARAGDARISIVRLEIGRLAGVALDALRFCFEICTHGTSLADATLDIVEIAARARCRSCGAEREVDSLVSACACGSFDQQLLTGHELRLKELEVT